MDPSRIDHEFGSPDTDLKLSVIEEYLKTYTKALRAREEQNGSRPIPTPWHADKMPGVYVVRDAKGQALAYLYSRDNEDEARRAKVLTVDEARRLAANIARLPEFGKAERED
jgi:hypothetical protein